MTESSKFHEAQEEKNAFHFVGLNRNKQQTFDDIYIELSILRLQLYCGKTTLPVLTRSSNQISPRLSLTRHKSLSHLPAHPDKVICSQAKWLSVTDSPHLPTLVSLRAVAWLGETKVRVQYRRSAAA